VISRAMNVFEMQTNCVPVTRLDHVLACSIILVSMKDSSLNDCHSLNNWRTLNGD